MNRNKRLVVSLLAAALSGLLVYGVYVLQLKQIKLQETAAVVVPRQFIAVGDTLTPAQLEMKRLPIGAITDDMIGDPAEVVGMETIAPLGAGEPLLRWKLDRYRLLPGEGEATFQIPREYVKSIASGIRAGDMAVVYVSDSSAASERLFERPVVVAGVKTSGNLEIDNPKNSNLLSMANGDKERMYASRRDANGTIDTINLNLTEAQWLLIDTVCKSGQAKLVVAYASNALDALAARRDAE